MKRALLIGINYDNTAYHLRGCINDIQLIKCMLIDKFEFSEQDITVLLEKEATCSAIVENMERLVRESRSGDQLYIHYSGHGSQFRDMNADETDQLDEIIIGYDHNWSDRMIRDDDLARIFSVLAEGVELVVVVDACHSATMNKSFDLDFVFNSRDIVSRYLECPIPRSSITDVNLDILQIPKTSPISIPSKGIFISGCDTNQTSADANFGGVYHGALTYGMVYLLQLNDYEITYNKLVEDLNVLMHQLSFTQNPKLNTDDDILKEKLFLKV